MLENISRVQAKALEDVDPSFKECLLYEDFMLRFNLLYKKGPISYNALSEKVMSHNKGIAFKRLHYLFPIFNEKIKQLTAGGFFDHWIFGYDLKPRNIVVLDVTNPFLSFDQIFIAFEIWFVMLFASFVVFIAENINFWLIRPIIRKICRTYVSSKLTIGPHKNYCVGVLK